MVSPMCSFPIPPGPRAWEAISAGLTIYSEGTLSGIEAPQASAASRASIATCSSFAIFHPYQAYGQLCAAIAVGPIELILRQAFNAIQIGIGQIRAVELCQA